MLFADDLLILGRTDTEIYKKIRIAQEWCSVNKMEINFEKTQILDKEKDKLWPIWSIEKDKFEDIKSVESFSYLGVPQTFKRQVQWTYGPHTNQIVSRAKKFRSAISKITVESIDRAEAIKVCWENVAIPSILFGCETTIFTTKTLKELETIQYAVAKQCLGVRWDTSGLGARVEAGMMSMSSRIMIQQLNYLNYVLAKPVSSIAHQAWVENVHGTWSSPLDKLWSDIKDKSCTRGKFGLGEVKQSVLSLENLNIEREIQNFSSLKYMTSKSLKPRGQYLRKSKTQNIIKAFRVGDWRIGVRELSRKGLVKDCPFGCQSKFDLAHFLFWCPLLDRVRKETGLYEFYNTSRMKWEMTDTDIIVKFLWAMNDDPMVVKHHGNILVTLRNKWYKLAKAHGISLGVTIK